jgi:Xaa-Pro aminopeptidase
MLKTAVFYSAYQLFDQHKSFSLEPSMKNDIDHLMKEANIDALFVSGPAAHNPAMTYFTGLVHVSDGYLLKKQGEEPVLFHFPMEREEAALTGLMTKNIDDYDIDELFKEAGNNLTKARAIRIRKILDEFGVQGRVSLYGRGEVGSSFGVFRELEGLLSNVELVAEEQPISVLSLARITKGEDEIQRIRKMGEITVNVVNDVAGYLTSHQAKDGVLVDRQGDVLTIGEVKRRIKLWTAMRGAEMPEGPIFAIGRDAGIPHNSGRDDQPIEIGKTIVFDIFPCESGGGYFYDFTRTWCLGYAPDDVQAVYEDVFDVYEEIYKSITPSKPCKDFQIQTCQLFEDRGHPTKLSDKRTEEGYVHSLAHGVGLAIHESPFFSNTEFNQAILQHGSVITIEPGLYYPDRGLGVRLEDSVWVRPDGVLETLVEYPMDLVLKVPGV